MRSHEKPMQVLLVEDDPHLRAMLKTAMGEVGHVVSTAVDGDSGYRIASESELDIILLDLGLPDLDGSSLIPMFRAVCSAPIIVISARDSELQKVAALDAGADDYLTKPFGIRELMARMRSTPRRSVTEKEEEPSGQVHKVGDLSIDIARRRVTVGDRVVNVTPVEFRLLSALARRGGRVTTHRQLLREVWGPHHEEDGHYLRIYMRQLRAKLEREPAQPRFLLTEPGVGYRLASD